MDGQCVYAFSRRQGVQSTSSAEAELYGACSVCLEWLGYEVDYRLHVDSSSAKATIRREGVGKVKHLDVRSLWLQQERQQHGLNMMKIPGEQNPADLGTKSHGVQRFEMLKRLIGLKDCADVRPR